MLRCAIAEYEEEAAAAPDVSYHHRLTDRQAERQMMETGLGSDRHTKSYIVGSHRCRYV